MTERTIRRWHPEAELTRLVDALEAELLAAPEDEIEALRREPLALLPGGIEAVRAVLAAAEAQSGLPPPADVVALGARPPATRLH